MTSLIKKIITAHFLKKAALPDKGLYVLFIEGKSLLLKVVSLSPKQVKTVLSDEADRDFIYRKLGDTMSSYTKYLYVMSGKSSEWESDAPADQVYDLLWAKSSLGVKHPSANLMGVETFLFGPFTKEFLYSIPNWLIAREIKALSSNIENRFESFMREKGYRPIEGLSDFSLSSKLTQGPRLKVDFTGTFNIQDGASLSESALNFRKTALEFYLSRFFKKTLVSLIETAKWTEKNTFMKSNGDIQVHLKYSIVFSSDYY